MLSIYYCHHVKLGNIKEMEGQPNGSQTQSQYLETKLTTMLQGVVLEMPEFEEQCIYKVPQKIRQVNPKAYTPRVVSIGPFHKPCDSNGENNTLKQMEEVKLKYLKRFLNRNNQLSMRGLFLKLIEKEKLIRSCYAEPIDCDSNDFLTMIIVDACFIIEHFLRHYTGLYLIDRDSISKHWMVGDVYQDLTLLENQLPFFVLEDIFNSAQPGMNVEFPFKNAEDMDNFAGPITNVYYLSFLGITFYYFQHFNYHNINPDQNDCPKHFTDLIRTFMQPSSIPYEKLKPSSMVKHLQSASELSEVGLVFKVSESQCLFDLKYHGGVMEMPSLIVYDNTETMFRNILSFEQCHYLTSPNITQYLFILDSLINTDKDVNILIDKKIIVNRTGHANVVATMVNNLCANVSLPFISEEYCSLCDNLNDFYENPSNKYKANFYYEYFNTPWKKASTIAATLLLLLTLIQTICSIVSLFSLF